MVYLGFDHEQVTRSGDGTKRAPLFFFSMQALCTWDFDHRQVTHSGDGTKQAYLFFLYGNARALVVYPRFRP
jgi:hypothetical protein